MTTCIDDYDEAPEPAFGLSAVTRTVTTYFPDDEDESPSPKRKRVDDTSVALYPDDEEDTQPAAKKLRVNFDEDTDDEEKGDDATQKIL